MGVVLPLTWLALMVIAPWLRMPPPKAPGAMLALTWLALMVAVPPLAMPPAQAIGPPWEVLRSIWLKLTVRKLELLPPMPPVPLAMPPPPTAAVLPSTWLALRVSVPAWFKMPPALPEVVLPSILLKSMVAAPDGPVPSVPEVIPPPALIIPPEEELPVTTHRLTVSVPCRLKMAPPGAGVLPPVRVRPCNVRFPVLATMKIRKVLSFPAMVVRDPLMVIRLVISGSPLLPSMGTVLLAEVRA